jgi:hypothetical protein
LARDSTLANQQFVVLRGRRAKINEKWQTRKDWQCFVESGPLRRESRQLLRVADPLQFFQIATSLEIQTLTMDFSPLNADVLLHLLEFVDPFDQFNLVLSGALKGFENVNIDLRKRYSEHFAFVSSCSQTDFCPESIIVELNWGYIVIARASSKSG